MICSESNCSRVKYFSFEDTHKLKGECAVQGFDVIFYILLKSKVQIDFDKSEYDLIGRLNTRSAAKNYNLSNDFLQKYVNILQYANLD